MTLDVAPEYSISPHLADFGHVVSVDLDTQRRRVDLVGDLTRLPVADRAADLVVCYHVLEHIPDDRAAMHEIARVLAPHGVAIVQVPTRPGPTDEDPGASPEERVVRFGQADHVRYYGDDDFVRRLTESGLRARVIRMVDIVPAWMREDLRLHEGETVWLCSRADQPEPEFLPRIPELWPEALQYVFQVVARRSHRMDEKAGKATMRSKELRVVERRLRRQRNSWRRRYRRLRRRRSVRVALRVGDQARRLRSGGRAA